MISRLDKSYKKNEFFKNLFSSQDENMTSLEQKLAECEAKLENLSNTKFAIDNRSIFVSVPLKLKVDKIYIPPFKRNHKEKAYFARLDKGKSFYVDAEIFKLMSKPTTKLQKKYVFVSTCHLCGIVGHIRPNCSLLRQKPKSETRSIVRNIDISKFVLVCHFCGCLVIFVLTVIKLKFNHSVFQSRIGDDISPVISL